MAGGGNTHHLRYHMSRRARFGQQTVAFPHQQIAYIERDGYAVLGMYRLAAVALGISILNVVVDERGLVKTFHRHRYFAKAFRHRLIGVVLEGLVGADSEQGPPALAVFSEPPAGDGLGFALCTAPEK